MNHTALHPASGRFDFLHGDEDWTTAHDQVAIETLADQMLEERLYADAKQFDDLMAGIDPSDYQPQLQRCLANLDRACKGELIALQAITQALSQIQRTVKREGERVWIDELRALAQLEIEG